MEIPLEIAGGNCRAWLRKMTGLALDGPLYANNRLWPITFASDAGSRTRHFFNPSILGISATLTAIRLGGFAAQALMRNRLFAPTMVCVVRGTRAPREALAAGSSRP